MGHAGTLDPLAVGVLPIMLGNATKMFDYLNLDRKIYVTEFTFGINTDTQDAEGDIQSRCSNIPSEESIADEISRNFMGKIMQSPPKVSAVSINGKRAYHLARAGVDFEIKPKSIEIFKFDLLRKSGEKSYMFRVECSKGTYIRSLCRDLADNLETCAYVSFLSREKSGFFEIGSAYTLEQLEHAAEKGEIETLLVKVDEPIGYMEEVQVPIEKQSIICNGGTLTTDIKDNENIRVYCGGDFIGIGQTENRHLKIKKKFYG